MPFNPFAKLQFYHIIYLMVMILLMISVIASYSLTGELWTPILQDLAGFGIMIGVSFVDFRKINKWYKPALFAAVGLLVCTVIFGRGGGGRTLSLGIISFQTFYIVTIFFLFYLCTSLAIEINANQKLDDHRAVGRLVLFVILTGLIAMRNISTATLLFVSGSVIFYVAGVRLKYLGYMLLIIGIAGGIYIGGSAIHERNKTEQGVAQEVKTRGGTGYNRIKYWLTGESDVEGYGRQMTLAQTAIARSAGLPHPGKGIIKNKMPEGENDYVFSLICEELSVWAGIAIILIDFIIFYNIILISRKADGYFVKLFSMAIAMLFIGQTIIHIGTNTNLIPATGQTLPFVSRGSTALFSTFVIFGILINMGKSVQKTVDADDDDLTIK